MDDLKDFLSVIVPAVAGGLALVLGLDVSRLLLAYLAGGWREGLNERENDA